MPTVTSLREVMPVLEQWEIEAGVWYDEDGNPNVEYRPEADNG
jgi:hypothetical protein